MPDMTLSTIEIGNGTNGRRLLAGGQFYRVQNGDTLYVSTESSVSVDDFVTTHNPGDVFSAVGALFVVSEGLTTVEIGVDPKPVTLKKVAAKRKPAKKKAAPKKKSAPKKK